MTHLLEYEFWKDEGAYYGSLFSGVLAKKDRLKKREYFAAQILKTSARPIRWLDVGSGEGSKVFETIQSMQQVEPAVAIELVAVEPSAFVIAALREKLAQLDGVSLEVRNDKFSLEMLQPNTYDCVSFFHAAYYLASEQEDFEALYKTAYASLRAGGLLLIQAVDEDADFDSYIEHLKMWASGSDTGDPAITKAEAELLIDQLTKVRRANPAAIVEASNVAAKHIRTAVYFARNTVIAQLLDELLAFQVNNSAGTQDTIDKARALGKQVIVRSYSE